MEKIEFKSQICTTKEQSQKLLALGLKGETADMVYHYRNSLSEAMRWELMPYPPVLRRNCHFNIEKLNMLMCKTSDGVVMSGEEYFDVLWGKDIPAWSLHRLIEMVADTPLQVGSQVGMYVEDTYNMVIQGIEWLISRNQFNQDYLE